MAMWVLGLDGDYIVMSRQKKASALLPLENIFCYWWRMLAQWGSNGVRIVGERSHVAFIAV